MKARIISQNWSPRVLSLQVELVSSAEPRAAFSQTDVSPEVS